MNSLKKKFGKFAVSQQEASNVSGGYIDIDPWGDGGGSGGSTGPRWYCSYVVKKGHHAGEERGQICPDKASADALKVSLESNGFQVDCYCLC